LRKTENKNKGWLIDFNASNTLQLCDKLVTYATNKKDIHIKHDEIYLTNNNIAIKTLYIECNETKPNDIKMQIDLKFNIDNIHSHFIRQLPDENSYYNRLNFELELFDSKNVLGYLEKATIIIKLVGNTNLLSITDVFLIYNPLPSLFFGGFSNKEYDLRYPSFNIDFNADALVLCIRYIYYIILYLHTL
jgi:hypothetical protein